MKKRVFDKVVPWMNGEITVYQVAKYAKTRWDTANKWLHIFKAEIEKQEKVINDKLNESIETKRGLSIWMILKNRLKAASKKTSSVN